MRVLVAYGTKRGGTEALARAVANGLLEAGHSVDVLAATQVDALDRWDAVVVGGAPYAWFWHRNAQRFIKRNVEDLFQAQPPLIIRLIETARPKLEEPPDEAPDWSTPSPTPPRPRAGADSALWVHRLVLWLCLFTGVTAVSGGVSLLMASAGQSPFEGYLLPGLVLFFIVGVGNLAAAVLEARRVARSELVASVAGAALTGWIVMQLLLMRTVNWLHLVYFVVGISTVGGALFLWRARAPCLPLPAGERVGERAFR